MKDIDLEAMVVRIHRGKGAKDRTLEFPKTLVDEMESQLAAAQILHKRDRENEVAGVYLPHALETKSPGAGKLWKWFWAFPSSKLSNDPRANVIRRHHIQDSTVNRAIQNGVRAAGIPKLVTAHTMRHSYATHQVLNGVDIKSVQEALGHSDIRTTEIYLRLARAMRGEMGSPLDRLSDLGES